MTVLDDRRAGATTATDGWLERDGRALASVLPRTFDVVAERGEGSWIVDVEGRRFLDFGSGIGVTNVGHCHPHVVTAIQEQAAKLVHTSVVVHHQRSIELSERIAALVPYMDQAQVFFTNSGAEAVDGAIKFARRTTGRPGVVAFRGGFHGRTIGGTSLTTAKARYREGYAPLLPSVSIAPYAVPFGPEGARDEAATAAEALAGLDALFTSEVAPADVAAMLVEPVLGEGGYVVPPVAWVRGLRDRCDRYGILLVFDEVQCGMGRTGRPFAAETFGVTPNVILFAKGVAAGLPLGGIIAPRALFERWPTGTHGSTFGGNPVACAAALASLDVLDREDCYERARRLGQAALERLGRLVPDGGDGAGPDGPVLDVRGVGLMIGVQLRDTSTAEAVQQACLGEGLLVLTCGPSGEVLRLIPPLTISDADFDHGLDILERALVKAA